MITITDDDRARIAKSIADAEQVTSAEIICVVMRAAGDYWSVPILWATIVALAWPWPLIWITTLSASTIYVSQLIVFAVVALALSIPRRRRTSLTPGWIRRRRARQAAREHFFSQGLHRTVNRSGVMIFVAAAERYAEILADDSIAQKVDDSKWRQPIADLLDALARNEAAKGLEQAVARCSAILAEAAPPRQSDRNELPDKVIVI